MSSLVSIGLMGFGLMLTRPRGVHHATKAARAAAASEETGEGVGVGGVDSVRCGGISNFPSTRI